MFLRNESKKAQNEHMFFQKKKLGLISKHFRSNSQKREDQCTSVLPQADWPELPYAVDFCKKCSSRKTVLVNVDMCGS